MTTDKPITTAQEALDEVEQIVALWHYTKGGYSEMCHVINQLRSRIPPRPLPAAAAGDTSLRAEAEALAANITDDLSMGPLSTHDRRWLLRAALHYVTRAATQPAPAAPARACHICGSTDRLYDCDSCGKPACGKHTSSTFAYGTDWSGCDRCNAT